MAGVRLISLIVVAAVLVVGCGPRTTAPRAGERPALIPLRHFFVNPDSNFSYKVSPDGKRVAWLESHRRRLTVWVRAIGTEDVRIIDTHSPRSIHWFTWAQDSRRILYSQDRDGDENFHVYRADVERPDDRPRDLTPFPGTRAWVQQVVRSDPDHVLIAHNARDKTVFDLYRADLDTGIQALIARNPGDMADWITDRRGNLRGGIRHLPTNERRLEVWHPDSQRWTPVHAWDLEESVRFLGFTADDAAMWLASNVKRDRIGVLQMHLATGRETLVYEHPSVDVEHVLMNARADAPLLAVAYPGYQDLHFFDRALGTNLNAFQTRERSGLRVLSFDDAERVLTVSVFTEAGAEYYLLDRATGARSLLGKSPMTAYAPLLAPVEPIAFTSRDGLTIHGYLTLPRGLEAKRLPLVLLVHGGPWARDYWGYNDTVQFLANRGYAVLQVNYRGSTGYGRAFQVAARGEFAGKMHDDLIDGVRWAVDQGIADPQRVGIVGASYGGYATLVGLAFTPDVFACGVDIVGPSNLVTLLELTPPYWKLGLPYWHRYVGDPSRPEDRRRMEAKSPLFRAHAVQRPLLIIHGANDARVKQQESDQMVTALRSAGKDVEYVVFSDEGHTRDYGNWRNRLKLYRRVEDFLAQHLGGRTAGFDFYELGALGR